MSEGPQVRRRTEWLHKHLAGRKVLRCQSVRDDIPAESLTGRSIERVFCKGKHIFIEFGGGVFLHNHLLMRGTWRRLQGNLLILPEFTWLSLYVGPYTICNIKGQMLKPANLDQVSAQCAALGPDAMDAPIPNDEIRGNIRQTELPICEALLDQSIVCGVGNIAKSEILHLARISPLKRGCDLSSNPMDRLLDAIRTVLWSSYQQGGRWTCSVYRRVGQACPRCGVAIRSLSIKPSKRATYFCPSCQRADA